MPDLRTIVKRMIDAGEDESSIAAVIKRHGEINHPDLSPEIPATPYTGRTTSDPQVVDSSEPGDFWGGFNKFIKSPQAVELGVRAAGRYFKKATIGLPGSLNDAGNAIAAGLDSLATNPYEHFRVLPMAFKEMGQQFADTVMNAGNDPEAFGDLAGEMLGQPYVGEVAGIGSIAGLNKVKNPAARLAARPLEAVGRVLEGTKSSNVLPTSKAGIVTRGVTKLASPVGRVMRQTGENLRLGANQVEAASNLAGRAPARPPVQGVPAGGGMGITRPRIIRRDPRAPIVDQGTEFTRSILEDPLDLANRGGSGGPPPRPPEGPARPIDTEDIYPLEPDPLVEPVDLNRPYDPPPLNRPPGLPSESESLDLSQPIGVEPAPEGIPTRFQDRPFESTRDPDLDRPYDAPGDRPPGLPLEPELPRAAPPGMYPLQGDFPPIDLTEPIGVEPAPEGTPTRFKNKPFESTIDPDATRPYEAPGEPPEGLPEETIDLTEPIPPAGFGGSSGTSLEPSRFTPGDVNIKVGSPEPVTPPKSTAAPASEPSVDPATNFSPEDIALLKAKRAKLKAALEKMAAGEQNVDITTGEIIEPPTTPRRSKNWRMSEPEKSGRDFANDIDPNEHDFGPEEAGIDDQLPETGPNEEVGVARNPNQRPDTANDSGRVADEILPPEESSTPGRRFANQVEEGTAFDPNNLSVEDKILLDTARMKREAETRPFNQKRADENAAWNRRQERSRLYEGRNENIHDPLDARQLQVKATNDRIRRFSDEHSERFSEIENQLPEGEIYHEPPEQKAAFDAEYARLQDERNALVELLYPEETRALRDPAADIETTAVQPRKQISAGRQFADEVESTRPNHEFDEDMLLTPAEDVQADIPKMESPVENPYDPRIAPGGGRANEGPAEFSGERGPADTANDAGQRPKDILGQIEWDAARRDERIDKLYDLTDGPVGEAARTGVRRLISKLKPNIGNETYAHLDADWKAKFAKLRTETTTEDLIDTAKYLESQQENPRAPGQKAEALRVAKSFRELAAEGRANPSIDFINKLKKMFLESNEEMGFEGKSVADTADDAPRPALTAEQKANNARKMAKKWNDRMNELDDMDAPDIEYRDIVSQALRGELKPGETWRGKVIKGVQHFNKIAGPAAGEVKATPSPLATNLVKSGEFVRKASNVEIGPKGEAFRVTGPDGSHLGDINVTPETVQAIAADPMFSDKSPAEIASSIYDNQLETILQQHGLDEKAMSRIKIEPKSAATKNIPVAPLKEEVKVQRLPSSQEVNKARAKAAREAREAKKAKSTIKTKSDEPTEAPRKPEDAPKFERRTEDKPQFSEEPVEEIPPLDRSKIDITKLRKGRINQQPEIWISPRLEQQFPALARKMREEALRRSRK